MEMEQSRVSNNGGAEAVLSLQEGSSIAVTYDPLFGPHEDLMLLELDEKLLPDILQQRVTLRGHPTEDAVLCTQTKTYSVKFVGTSNSVLLIPPSDLFGMCVEENAQHVSETSHNQKASAAIIKVAPGSMELVEVAPRIDKLKLLLEKNPYESDELEMVDAEGTGENGKCLYTWEDLVNMIQASDHELRRGLQALSAVEINGYWRIIDEKYMDLILTMLVHSVVMNDWSFNSLKEDEVLDVLESDGFPRILALHCLQVYGNKVDKDLSNKNTWILDERQVCVHFARKVLKGGKMKMEVFAEEWRKKIPAGMEGTFDMLEGEVLTDRLGVDTLVRAFSVSSLPSNPAERFSILFKERPKWELKDIRSYIRDLSVPGLSLEDMLLKYTRRTQATNDADPIFTAR